MNDFDFRRRFCLGTLIGAASIAAQRVEAQAQRSRLKDVRIVRQDALRIYLDFEDTAVQPQMFTLGDPNRLVIDLPATELSAPLETEGVGGMILGLRSGQDGDRLRLVFDLATPVQPSFRRVARGQGLRVLVDLGVDPLIPAPLAREVSPAPEPPSESLRDVIVAIDAGHGGKDPGAIGQRQTREKDIVLAVAQRLAQRLERVRGIRPVLIRKDDTYIPLRERVEKARELPADIFVSIHADAFKRLEAVGSSVYALSLKGASSEAAQWIADQENRADALFGSVSLEGYSKDVQQTLLDLTQGATLESSLQLGDSVLQQLKSIGPVHKREVEQANFMVLRAPDIPSILIETAFISNLGEEKKLNSARFQSQLADAIARGLEGWLTQHAPGGTLLAAGR